MNGIVLLDIIGAILFGTAMAIIIFRKNEGNAVARQVRLFLFCIPAIFFLVELSNILEHTGITSYFDNFEDYLETLIPAFFMFFIFSLRNSSEFKKRLSAEDALRDSEELYRSLVENIDLGVTLIDKDHNIIKTNSAQGRFFNKSPSDFIGGKCFRLFEKREEVCAHCPGVKALSSGKTEEIVTSGKIDDGKEMFARVKAFPILGEGRYQGGFVELVEDITDSIKNEESLADEKERLAVTLRCIGDGVITTDTEGKVVLINKIAEDLTGWSSEEAMGRQLPEIFNIIEEQSEEPHTNPAEEVIRTGASIELPRNIILISREGRRYNVADSGAPIRDRESRIIGVVIVFRDVTRQLRDEQEMLKVKKLESLGVLAGGIAHDFNNILTAILGNVNLALFDPDLKKETRKALEDSELASIRAKNLTRQLLTFAKGGEPVLEATSLEEVIRESADFILHGDSVACQYDIPPALWSVDIDKGQISQVIQNVVLNASQASPRDGLVSITCKNLESIEYEGVHLPADRKYVRITISDKGVGIPPSKLDHIFDPYFTTKEAGSGLGLAITRSIINKHRGRIEAESTPGAGTAFHIYLPSSAGKKDDEVVSQARVPLDKGIRVLMMDDDAMLRNVVETLLKRLGHQVVLTQEGHEAVQAYKNSVEPFDLVILDLTVPAGMGGRDCAREILNINPQARIVVASGYSTDPVMANYREYGFCGAIEKPFHLEEFREVIEAALQSD